MYRCACKRYKVSSNIGIRHFVYTYSFAFCSPLQASLEKERSDDHADVQAKFEKLDMLEQEYMKLTETQNLAEVL